MLNITPPVKRPPVQRDWRTVIKSIGYFRTETFILRHQRIRFGIDSDPSKRPRKNEPVWFVFPWPRAFMVFEF